MIPLTVSNNADWNELRERNLMTILDPMIFRTADIFLAGRESYHDDTSATEAWMTISKNIGALVSFFDAIILRQHLPIFSYWETFHERGLLELNNNWDFLVPVIVTGEVYEQSKSSALQELRTSKPIPQELADDIVSELQVFGYNWQPGLEELGALSPTEALLQTFLLGGLLFGGYAQQLSLPYGSAEQQAEHLMQPKRSSLFLAATLGDAGKTTTREASLLRRFKKLSKELPADAIQMVQLPSAPSFLPLLLRQDPSTPQDLLKLALEWRDKQSVRKFREWYGKIDKELYRNNYPPELEQELKGLRRQIAQEIGRVPEKSTTLSAKVGANLATSVGGEIGATQEVDHGRIKWFFQSLLPGYSYRKLFVRMAIAQGRYMGIDQHLGEIWHRTSIGIR